jgi:hypothetical protein
MTITSLQYMPSDHKSEFNLVVSGMLNLLKPTGCVVHQQVYNLRVVHSAALYLYVSYLSEDKQRLVPLTS